MPVLSLEERKALCVIEIWKDIPGYEGLYQASSWGRVRSMPRPSHNRNGPTWLKGKLLSPGKAKRTDHLHVNLRKNNAHKGFGVHRLVLMTFIGPCPEGMESCHFPDRDPSNNRLDNLRWGTRLDNGRDKSIHGTVDTKGDKNPAATMTDDKVIELRKWFRRIMKNVKGRRAPAGTIQRKAEEFGVCTMTIISAIRGDTWPHLPLAWGKCEWGWGDAARREKRKRASNGCGSVR